MNEITSYQSTQLPDTLEDLTQFVLVGKAKLDAYMLKLRTINKLSVAQGIRDQTLKEAQEVSTALIAAEQRIGELLLAIPSSSGRRTDLETSSTQVEKVKTKTETVNEMGYSKDEVSDYQQMAKNPEIVAKIMNEAIANGDVVTKSQVMKEIAEAKRQAKAEMEAENTKLRVALSESETKRIQVEQNQKTKEVIKEVEVVPDDYEELKDKVKQIDRYEQERKFMKSEYDKIASKWKKAESEKEQILREMNEPNNKELFDIKSKCFDLCSGVRYFIGKYSYKFSKNEFDTLNEYDKRAFEHALSEMRKWVMEMSDEIIVEV